MSTMITKPDVMIYSFSSDRKMLSVNVTRDTRVLVDRPSTCIVLCKMWLLRGIHVRTEPSYSNIPDLNARSILISSHRRISRDKKSLLSEAYNGSNTAFINCLSLVDKRTMPFSHRLIPVRLVYLYYLTVFGWKEWGRGESGGKSLARTLRRFLSGRFEFGRGPTYVGYINYIPATRVRNVPYTYHRATYVDYSIQY